MKQIRQNFQRFLTDKILPGFFLACFFLSEAASGETIQVSSVPALQLAITKASTGDILVLANGTYLNNTLTIGKSNITVKAATPGKVFLNGTNDINITGNDITFSGFQFTSGNMGEAYVIEVPGSRNKLTELNFNGYSAKKYIHIQEDSQYNEISYCNLENKPASAVVGCTIQISTSPTVIGYHKIKYCSFQNFPGPGGDYGNEPIRIGLSTEMTNISRTIVEYCYFSNVGAGDGESISLKSSENICRFNTFSNNSKGMLVFRHGYRNVAYSNFFINGSGGIRIKEGGNHFIYNNYFETGAADAITLQFVAEYPLNNIHFAHNTFVNCGNINLAGAGPTSVNFINNLFQKKSGNIFTNANGGTSWAGNIYSGSLGISIPSGMKNADPKLEMNASGYFGLSAYSPAIDAASVINPLIMDLVDVDDDPKILFDISGQTRPEISTYKDVGCDELSTGNTTNQPLKLSDVGPTYLKENTTGLPVESQKNETEPIIYPNPASQSIQINFRLQTKSEVSIGIYNGNGKLVKKCIWEEYLQAGDFHRSFDISELNRGLYFASLHTKEFRKTIKLMVLN